ncbi:MAG: hypothetical protein ACKPGK_11935, partial [Verrucomicrobiota bacterium]
MQDGRLEIEALLREAESVVPPGVRRSGTGGERDGRTGGRGDLEVPSTGTQQGVEIQRLAILEHQGALEFMGQLADVAGP